MIEVPGYVRLARVYSAFAGKPGARRKAALRWAARLHGAGKRRVGRLWLVRRAAVLPDGRRVADFLGQSGGAAVGAAGPLLEGLAIVAGCFTPRGSDTLDARAFVPGRSDVLSAAAAARLVGPAAWREATPAARQRVRWLAPLLAGCAGWLNATDVRPREVALAAYGRAVRGVLLRRAVEASRFRRWAERLRRQGPAALIDRRGRHARREGALREATRGTQRPRPAVGAVELAAIAGALARLAARLAHWAHRARQRERAGADDGAPLAAGGAAVGRRGTNQRSRGRADRAGAEMLP